MGYTTYFSGQFDLDAPLTEDQAAYLKMFSGTRRMTRDLKKLERMVGPKGTYADVNRECLGLLKKVGLGLGPNGAYYCSGGDFGQDHEDPSVKEYNGSKPMPSFWCQWVPTEDRKGIEHDGGEKFYAYVEWIAFIIEHFLEPWGRTLNGNVTWEGEESDDRGVIIVKDNAIATGLAQTTYVTSPSGDTQRVAAAVFGALPPVDTGDLGSNVSAALHAILNKDRDTLAKALAELPASADVLFRSLVTLRSKPTARNVRAARRRLLDSILLDSTAILLDQGVRDAAANLLKG